MDTALLVVVMSLVAMAGAAILSGGLALGITNLVRARRKRSSDQLLTVKSLRIKNRTDKTDLLDVTFNVSTFDTI